MARTIVVKQDCFLTLEGFKENPMFRKGNGGPGVYIWGFSMQGDYQIPGQINQFVPYYVGKVDTLGGSVYQRTQEHLAFLRGGNYPIFDIQSAYRLKNTDFGHIHRSYQKASAHAKKSNDCGPLLPNPAFQHLLHFPEGIHTMLRFTTDSVLKAQVEWMLKRFCIMYFKPLVYSQNDISDLEKYIGNLVEYNKIITKKYNQIPSIHLEIENSKGNIVVSEYEHLFKSCLTKMTSAKYGL
jgi:hypothetical protein